jgi:hypothetical protein
MEEALWPGRPTPLRTPEDRYATSTAASHLANPLSPLEVVYELASE